MKNKDFFAKKHEWSIIKDELLRCYLRPYSQKIFQTGRPLVYVDCFAGAGLFGSVEPLPEIDIEDDDVPTEWGSPLIALKELSRAVKSSRTNNAAFYPCFIEKEYHQQLEDTLNGSQFKKLPITIFHGDYRSEILELKKRLLDWGMRPNLFCYLDPYGVKDLKMSLFEQLLSLKPNSFELLINFNSFGLFRYACGAVEVDIREKELKDVQQEMVEREAFPEKEPASSRLVIFNEIFGSDEWISIIDLYRDKWIDGYAAESKLAELYKSRLKDCLGFKYVLSIPIKFNIAGHPKYRMVHATNHCDGAVLMGRVMHKREHRLFDCQEKQIAGCRSLFDPEDYTQAPSIESSVLMLLEDGHEWKGTEFFAEYYDKIGLTSRLQEILHQMEQEGKVRIHREPKVTKNGKPTTFIWETNGNKLFIKKS